jgi:transposase-like protein
MTSKNKTYQPEFKREAIRLAKDPNNTVAGAARDLELYPNLLHRWIRQAAGREATGRLAFAGHEDRDQRTLQRFTPLHPQTDSPAPQQADGTFPTPSMSRNWEC